MGRSIILDVDTGTDDAVAIMFAALHPEIELLAVTTVNGNVPLADTTDNTLRVLDWIERPEIPVFAGLSRPIARSGFPGARHFDRDSGNDPHGSALPIPPPRGTAQDVGAVEYLVETLRSTTEPLTLVPVGPLSNIATVLTIDPSLTEAVEEVVVMGGGHATTNVTASAEFNIWADPEAANVVFSAGFRRLTLVPLDATHRALVTRSACRVLEGLATPAGIAAARFIGRRIDAYGASAAGEEAAPVHDVLCTAYLVRPDVITTRHLALTVETASPLTIGRTVMDTRPGSTATRNAHVAFDADAALLIELLTQVFGTDA
ncbi:nucleoside hydrolase [Marinitenerispora sediminis]|uniref:Nucleoside hydrolase n=1 Tax=Marinitenerispora sediminis TaxID=1931232 RepID=A0A368TDA0_9ACTN|nr:nucleoside hydrolase [Marinitenerispora sediminis]RCV52955.1 nucleoside hydrolase [Marinitenerispora sediminis]RCV58434.1 nucleoside hydrolase [Marinitenerispora sediminis]RCV61786.1 nucleoside hydrolase [Marinitenerispora sediminis]